MNSQLFKLLGVLKLTFLFACNSESYKKSEFKESFDESRASTFVSITNSKYKYPIKANEDITISSLESVNGEVVFSYYISQGSKFNHVEDEVLTEYMKHYLKISLCSKSKTYKVLRANGGIPSKHIFCKYDRDIPFYITNYLSYECP